MLCYWKYLNRNTHPAYNRCWINVKSMWVWVWVWLLPPPTPWGTIRRRRSCWEHSVRSFASAPPPPRSSCPFLDQAHSNKCFLATPVCCSPISCRRWGEASLAEFASWPPRSPCISKKPSYRVEVPARKMCTHPHPVKHCHNFKYYY